MGNIYSESYYIVVGDKIYELQAVDALDEKPFFLLKKSGKVRHTITFHEPDKRVSDNHINGDELNEIVKWIEKLFM